MKINYRNYPVLEKLQKGSFGELDFSKVDQPFFKSTQWAHVHYIWKQNTTHFRKEINFISVHFADAAEKASNRFLDVYKNLFFSQEYLLHFHGTFIVPGGFTYMLSYTYNEEKDHTSQVLYWFIKTRMVGCFYLNDASRESELWISEDFKKAHKIDTPQKELQVVTHIIGRLLVLKLLKDCTKVETRKLPAQSETIDVDRNYINETHFEITMLDSLWLNTLVKSDIFNNYGRFDVKLCGKESKDHHLKWIPKAKTGYIAPARILKYIKINGG